MIFSCVHSDVVSEVEGGGGGGGGGGAGGGGGVGEDPIFGSDDESNSTNEVYVYNIMYMYIYSIYSIHILIHLPQCLIVFSQDSSDEELTVQGSDSSDDSEDEFDDAASLASNVADLSSG